MSLTPVPPPQHKAGDSFERLLTIPPEFADGFFVGWTAKSEIRNEAGHLVAACTCDWLNPVTTRHLSLTVIDTKGWKPGLVEIDVFFLSVVFKDAERMVCTDFTAREIDVFTRFGIAEDDAG